MSVFLTPAELLYRKSMLRRRQAMLERRLTEKAPCPVISVGNITTGGTGKTPTVQWTATFLQNLGLKVAVVARGYGGGLSDTGAVVSRGDEPRYSATEVGDEAVLHARNLPGVSVVIGKDRHQAAQRAVEECGAEVIVLDDGFQFWSLPRICEIVLLDARRPFDNGHLLPAGHLREEPESLNRADAVLLTRASLASGPRILQSRQEISTYTQAPIFEADHEPKGIRAENSGEFFSLRALDRKPFVLVSAIVDNASFRRAVEQAGAQVMDHVVRRDHHQWTRHEIKSISKKWQGNIAGILTTEKDATKIDPDWVQDGNPVWRSPFPLASLRIGLQLGQTEEAELQELIVNRLKAA